MATTWMGRYRRLVEELVRHRNYYARAVNSKTEEKGDVSLSVLEWEMLEYIIEHDGEDFSMIRISEKLAIPQSSFSKFTRTLCGYGLLEKYRMVGNRKNIVLRPTQKGIEFYNERVQDLVENVFGPFFKTLDPLSDEDVDRIAQAITHLNSGFVASDANAQTGELVKLEDN